MSRIHSGGMVPLFDRLGLKLEKFEGISKNYLTPIGVEQSVMLELNRLATTRSRLTFDEFIKNNLSVLDYGLPDFTGYSVQNDDHRVSVKTAVKKAITTFEPSSQCLINLGMRSGGSSRSEAILTITSPEQCIREL